MMLHKTTAFISFIATTALVASLSTLGAAFVSPSSALLSHRGYSRSNDFAELECAHMKRSTRLEFWGNKDTSHKDSLAENELAVFSNLATTDLKFDSLSILIKEWSKLFVGDYAKEILTTPVTVVPAPSRDDEAVTESSGVQLLFRKNMTGDAYNSKKEEDSTKKKPQKVKKEGGVEVMVERRADGSVTVRAVRCEIDDDTLIKEMSEEAIVENLKKAIDAWKKEQK